MGSGDKYNFEDAIRTFFTESRELLVEMESSLLKLEVDNRDKDSIAATFRAVHTIKGSSGMFGFNDISDFSHVVENLLDDIRSGSMQLSSGLIDLLLESHDHIIKLLDFFEKNRKGILSREVKDESESIIKKFNSHLQVNDGSAVQAGPVKTDEDPDDSDKAGEGNNVQNKCWHISLRPGIDTFRNSLDPQSFINYLNTIGKIENIRTIFESLPPAKDMDPENCYLGFEIDFLGDTAKQKIEEVFEFLADDCKISILPPASDIMKYVQLINDLPEQPMLIGQILTESGSLTEGELKRVLELQENMKQPPLGEIIVDENILQKPVIEAALEKQKKIISTTIRVDARKLDRLINTVGELVINEAKLRQMLIRTEDIEINDAMSVLSLLIEETLNSSMDLRMVQIGDTLKRFNRVVRDLSRDEGKEIDLMIYGEETELDKTIVERITDPIMHLIRNAVDHGIRQPGERIKAGKPARGKISLKSFYETGSVVIEVSDDGNGLNREKILNRAIEKGMVTKAKSRDLSENEILQFIFEPGFSTAEKVTNVSGRGVGMDVVKKNIEMLRGSIVIQSREGVGTTVRIYLPLTLANIDGFMVSVGRYVFVLPLSMIIETIELPPEINNNSNTRKLFSFRDEVLPYIRLRDFFQMEDYDSKNEYVVVVEYARRRVGLVIDRALGELQTVIKPLGKVFKKLKYFSGVTILSNGDMALVLDVPRMVKYIRASNIKKAG